MPSLSLGLQDEDKLFRPAVNRRPVLPGDVQVADSDEAARVYRTYSAHRSNLMPPTNPI